MSAIPAVEVESREFLAAVMSFVTLPADYVAVLLGSVIPEVMDLSIVSVISERRTCSGAVGG